MEKPLKSFYPALAGVLRTLVRVRTFRGLKFVQPRLKSSRMNRVFLFFLLQACFWKMCRYGFSNVWQSSRPDQIGGIAPSLASLCPFWGGVDWNGRVLTGDVLHLQVEKWYVIFCVLTTNNTLHFW